MIKNYSAFHEKVALKYQLYNGLFLNLPFEHIRNAGILLPLFSDFCSAGLERGQSPKELVEAFLADPTHRLDDTPPVNLLFRFLQFVERQVVLFDALEDAAFPSVQDVDGAGSLKDTINQIIRGGKLTEYRDLLKDYRLRVVLTAHPTQFYPDEILGIISDLSKAIAEDDLAAIYELLLQMGKTRFKNQEKPTPLDEARSLLWFIENIFYHTVPAIQRRALSPIIGDANERTAHPPIIELGFWPGGDRDGNPFVTADLTLKIGNLLRSTILELYREDLRHLRRRLTFPGVVERLHSIKRRLDATAGNAPAEGGKEEAYETAEELLADLAEVQRTLHADHSGLYGDRLEELATKVRIFGFHCATMDIRQDSRVHTTVVSTLLTAAGILKKGEYESLNYGMRLAIVSENLGDPSRIVTAAQYLPEGIARDTLGSLRSAAMLQQRNGQRGVHRYIISNTRSAADIVEVCLLSAVATAGEAPLILDVVPLFETIEDLATAEEILAEVFDHAVYRGHLSSRNQVQTIMLGFSDGTKDGGYVTANWEIFQTKRRLTALCRKRGVRPVFFDGRGGPPARGGGNTHLFYRSLGREIESTEIHITVQGQTVSSKYGTVDMARYNLEQMVSAGIANKLLSANDNRLSAADIDTLNALSAASNEHYQRLKNHPRFVPYLATMTPLIYYGQTNIASRPTSRRASDDIDLDSLRAIPFVGAWSQMKQNVPGYFGLGTGIASLAKSGKEAALRSLYDRSLFFRTLVNNAMQSLSKTYFPLTSFIEHDEEFGGFWSVLRDEAELTIRTLGKVSGHSELLAGDPTIRDSIRMREEMIRPVLVVQQYALATLRELTQAGIQTDSSRTEAMRKLIIKSLAASVNASRNAV